MTAADLQYVRCSRCFCKTTAKLHRETWPDGLCQGCRGGEPCSVCFPVPTDDPFADDRRLLMWQVERLGWPDVAPRGADADSSLPIGERTWRRAITEADDRGLARLESALEAWASAEPVAEAAAAS